MQAQETLEIGAATKKGKGLSELARQLRVLQAKNQKLAAEIGRLERQLRIVAETSGVSVTDLRGTLQRACESEAYGELQSQLASLQAQLEETQLKQRKALDFDKEAEAKKTANLELRIGELEEVESSLRQEVGQLYKSQDAQAGEANKLRAANDRQAKEIDILQKRLQEMEAQVKQHEEKVQTVKPPIPVQAKAKDPPARQSEKVKKPPPKAPKPAPPKPTARDTAPQGPPDAVSTTYEKGPHDFDHAENSQLLLLRNQVAARGKELELKESQYKTRFTMQEERIVDMEQQLSSLYTAFEMIDQEHLQEKRSKEELTKALRLADSQVAKAVDHLQRSTSSPNPQPAGAPTPRGDSSIKGTPSFSPDQPAGVNPSGTYAVPSPRVNSPAAATTGVTDVLFSGSVMKRGRLNRWKKQHASLCRGFATFQLHLSDPAPPQKKPTVYSLVVFRSNFEVLKGLPKYPYALRIKINKFEKGSPELVLAVEAEGELQQWIAGLHEAVNGANAPNQTKALAPMTPVAVAPPVFTPASSGFDGDRTYDSDLQAALQESLRESEQEFVARADDAQGQGSQVPARPDETDLDAALAESLRTSEEESAARSASTQEKGAEESKEEIGHSESSDAELNAALAESLLVSGRTVDL